MQSGTSYDSAWINPILIHLGAQFFKEFPLEVEQAINHVTRMYSGGVGTFHNKKRGNRPLKGKDSKGNDRTIKPRIVIALLIAMCYRTNEEPFVMRADVMESDMNVPRDLAINLEQFLSYCGIPLTKLGNQAPKESSVDYFGGGFEELVALSTEVSDSNEVEGFEKNDRGEGEWMEMFWPGFTFQTHRVFPESINRWKITSLQ
jgi:hypothetical protein